ncbi:hypothetical protein [Nocardioides lacusdianchii]|uniref:hypothetical protein n=1 Tax=Nocardioides lacusdianchii TaxID=2783664 RepID=UPI001CCCD8BD|nr:hypothetical protein [Nocardioides lacusdianchii]
MHKDNDASGKRRSFSQRVGDKGELAFRNFCDRHGLLPNKVEQDYGIDFMFQVDLDHESHQASNIANSFAGACVRASTSKNGKVKLNRGDAANLLNSRSPLVFVLAHIKGKTADTAKMYHRLVDQDLLSELQDFLDTDAERMSLRPGACLPESQFAESLSTLLSPGFLETVRLNAAQAAIRAVLPQASVEIRRQPDGQLTLVSNVDYFSMFEHDDADSERAVLETAFGDPAQFFDRATGLNPRPEIVKYLRHLPQTALFGGVGSDTEVELEVTSGHQRAVAGFTHRRIGTHWAYVHPAGVSLIISHARERDGQMVHETEVFIDPLADNVLEDIDNALEFFELCSDGAAIREVGKGGESSGLSVTELFRPLDTLATLIRSWRVCRELRGWPERAVALRDVTDAEVFYTLSGIAQLATEPESMARHSFVIETVSHPIDISDLVERPVQALVPVIANLMDQTLVLTVDTNATTFAFDGEVRGFRFQASTDIEVETRPLAQKASIYPEVVVDANSPTFALAPGRHQGSLPSELEDIRIGWQESEDPEEPEEPEEPETPADADD